MHIHAHVFIYVGIHNWKWTYIGAGSVPQSAWSPYIRSWISPTEIIYLLNPFALILHAKFWICQPELLPLFLPKAHLLSITAAVPGDLGPVGSWKSQKFPPSSGFKLEARKSGCRDWAAKPPARVAVLHGTSSSPLKWREGNHSTAGCFGWVFLVGFSPPSTFESEEAASSTALILHPGAQPC